MTLELLSSMGWELGKLALIDGAVLALFALALLPLSRYNRPAFAVLRRNFIGYFSDPTGYAFLCLFVLLTSFAAFWPHEFFNSNLANLDQLNRMFPLVMLVFIPAITMSIWADERRQGTDELLLTLPAADADIVTGKFLAAAAVYTCSLMFSQVSTYMVLVSLTLGDLDTGLICSTYFGYWLVGLAMLALGMVASFLTRNLTVGFILGAAFNAPLVFATYSDVIIRSVGSAQLVSRWGMAAKLDDLGRGVISLSSVIYFVMITAVGLYLSMILIGSRHWAGGQESGQRSSHYLTRTLALIILGTSLTVIFTNHDIRKDATVNGVSSLSEDTLKILRDLETKHTIYIDAFIGAQVPEDYVKTRFTLVSMVKEFQSRAKGKVQVRLQENVEPFSETAVLAEKQFGIKAQTVRTRSRGVFKDEPVILGAAFTCGLEKVVVPFFDYGIPVEYELVRSISTVAKGQRKRLGIVKTDANLNGGFDFSTGQFRQIPKQQIVEELEKQYDVEQVDPNNPIDVQRFDVLFVVQPSSLGEPELQNVLAAIKSGMPAAVFEDPMPVYIQAPGTGEPKRPPGGMGMFGGGGPPAPKGDIDRFFRELGVKMEGRPQGPGTYQPNVVWQSFNPYKKIQVSDLPDEYVFVHNDAPGADEPLSSNDPITSGLSEVLFPYSGNFDALPESKFTFTPIVRTGTMAGSLSVQDVRDGQQDPLEFRAKHAPRGAKYTLAAHIRGKSDGGTKGSDPARDDSTDDVGSASKSRPVNVVLVADIDLMSTLFVRIRAQPEQEFNWHFENVTFVLNVVDALSGDDAYIGVRKRKTKYSTLKVIEQQTNFAREKERMERDEYESQNKKELAAAEAKAKAVKQEAVDAWNDIQNEQKSGVRVDPSRILEIQTKKQLAEDAAERSLSMARERLKNELTKKTEEIRRQMDSKIQGIQNEFKLWAVVLPPIPPLLVGFIVFAKRRLREREGIAKTRMK
jgi:ABC-2 type transport system permease protein